MFAENQTSREIADAGSPPTPIAGTQAARYKATYEQHRTGQISRDQAVRDMGNAVGDDTTGGSHQNYRDFYGKGYADHYDQLHPPKPPGGGP
jgi:hypothetical protein